MYRTKLCKCAQNALKFFRSFVKAMRDDKPKRDLVYHCKNAKLK